MWHSMPWQSLTESGSIGMKGGVGDSGAGPHSVWTSDWNSLSCSSLRTRDNILNQQNSLFNLMIWLLNYVHLRTMLLQHDITWIYFPFGSIKSISHLITKPLKSPVSVVWSVVGLLSLLAFCLCHLFCPSLVSVHRHWSLSNVHGPKKTTTGMSRTAAKRGGRGTWLHWFMNHRF